MYLQIFHHISLKFERNWSNFNQENFVRDYFSIDWKALLKIEQENINFSLETYVGKIKSLLDTHAPLNKNVKCKLKFKAIPWITPGLEKPVAVKNKLLKVFIHLKEPYKKLYSHKDYKKCRNMLSTFLKRSRQKYFQNFLNLTGII